MDSGTESKARVFEFHHTLADDELDDNESEEVGLVLRNWTPSDFSRIYIRYRPHLEIYAHRLLSDPYQVEEVVQDAFLYLMTTLPELDSHVGVLRFLKWKVKLLALDAMRRDRRQPTFCSQQLEDVPSDAEIPGESIERAEDAAIVSLALARLHPRHREVLIASVYEEKSTQQVAAQMNMNPNALRQLLFRARSSFKHALVGEAQVAGKSISEILAVAYKNSSARSTQVLSAILLLAIGGWGFSLYPSEDNFSEVASLSANGSEHLSKKVAPQDQKPVLTGQDKTDESPTGLVFEDLENPGIPEGISPLGEVANVGETFSTARAEGVEIVTELSQFFDQNLVFTNLDYGPANLSSQSSQLITIESNAGLVATLVMNLGQPPSVDQAHFTISLGGHTLYIVPQVGISVWDPVDDGWTLSYAASDLIVGDFSGKFENQTSDLTSIHSSKFLVTVRFDSSGSAIDSHLGIVSSQ